MTSKEINIEEEKKKLRNPESKRSFLYITISYFILVIIITITSYASGIFGDKFYGIEHLIPELIALSFIFGYFALLFSKIQSVYLNSMVGFAVCVLILPIVQWKAVSEDFIIFYSDILVNSTKMALATLLGSLAAIPFQNKVTFREATDMNSFFERIKNKQSSFERIEKFIFKVITILTFLIWMYNLTLI